MDALEILYLTKCLTDVAWRWQAGMVCYSRICSSGWSLNDCATQLGVSVSTINYLIDEVLWPDDERIKRRISRL